MQEMQKLIVKAPTTDFSGYATVARSLVLELYKLGRFDIYLEDIVWVNSGNLILPEEDQCILDSLKAKQYGGNAAEDILIHFSVATEFFGAQSPFKKTIGFTMLETDRTSQHWAAKCNEMDAIIVPSMFCMTSFMQSNITKPIRMVPFGIDFDQYIPEGEALLKDLPTKFNFLSVGQWIQAGDRKNMLGTIQTFLQAFKGNPDVGLILKTYAVGAGTIDKITIKQMIEGFKTQLGISAEDGPQIYVVHGALSPENMIKLYRNGDAFLLPSAGEAWGMPLLEAAAMELPIITTGGTGAGTFLNPDHAILLNHTWQQIGNRINWPGVYEAYQSFAIPDSQEYALMVSKIYKHHDRAKAQAVAQREELITRDFSWKAAATKFADVIDELNA